MSGEFTEPRDVEANARVARVLMIASAALFAVAAFYVLFVWFGRFRPAATYAIVLVVLALLIRPLRSAMKDGAIAFMSASVLVCLLIVDGLLFAHVLNVGQAHDIGIIPHHSHPILTSNGHLVYTQQRNYAASATTTGQVARYLPDDNFYERRNLTIRTDALGFRNGAEASKGCIQLLLMGDSFAFGYATDQDKIWSELLNASRSSAVAGRVYNIGVYGDRPSGQVELMRHLFERRMLRPCPGMMAAMLFFEGNDLTDPNTYSVVRTRTQYLARLVEMFREGALIAKIRQLVESRARANNAGPPAYVVLKSPKLGNVAFSPTYIDAVATYSENEDAAERKAQENGVAEAISRLARQIRELGGGKAAVIFVPDKASTYGSMFQGLRAIGENKMSKVISKISREAGLVYYDIVRDLRALADQGELAFWRDDTHLNERGHRILAGAVCRSLELGCPQTLQTTP